MPCLWSGYGSGGAGDRITEVITAGTAASCVPNNCWNIAKGFGLKQTFITVNMEVKYGGKKRSSQLKCFIDPHSLLRLQN